MSASYVSHNGELVTENYTSHICPVMEWISDLVTDTSLCQVINWFPQKKWLVDKDGKKELYDDLECGEDWWDKQVR